MDPIDRANLLKREADYLLEALCIRGIFAPFGEILFTGSYFLDVMVYPDVDLYVPVLSIAQIFEAGEKLALSPLVKQVVFEKSSSPDLPGGLYLKPRIEYGNWGRPWKFDIWSIDRAVIADKIAKMRSYSEQMTPELREQIITYKVSILNEQGRTPMYSGYFIYQAFFDEGLTDFKAISHFLRQNGIQV